MLYAFNLGGWWSSPNRGSEAFGFRCITTSKKEARKLLLHTIKKIENEYDDTVKKLIDKLEDLYKNKTYDDEDDDEELNNVMCDLFHQETAIRTDGLIRSNKCSMVLFDLCPDTIVYNNQNNKTSTLENFILYSKFYTSSSDHYEDYYADNVFIHLGGFY